MNINKENNAAFIDSSNLYQSMRTVGWKLDNGKFRKFLYDKAVIVSGDGDFYPLAEYLAKQNKLKRVLIPNEAKYSALLNRINPNESNYLAFISRARGKLEYFQS